MTRIKMVNQYTGCIKKFGEIRGTQNLPLWTHLLGVQGVCTYLFIDFRGRGLD